MTLVSIRVPLPLIETMQGQQIKLNHIVSYSEYLSCIFFLVGLVVTREKKIERNNAQEKSMIKLDVLTLQDFLTVTQRAYVVKFYLYA